MNKVSGSRDCFALLNESGSTVTIGYDLQQVSATLYEWREVYLYRKQTPIVGFAEVKDAILADINHRTDEKILSGFTWTPEGGDPIPVWLSTENEFNYKAAYDLAEQTEGASLPVKFKLGEDEEGTPIYHTFTTLPEFRDFYTKAVAHIQQTLQDGWQEKDSIDWTPYEALFPTQE